MKFRKVSETSNYRTNMFLIFLCLIASIHSQICSDVSLTFDQTPPACDMINGFLFISATSYVNFDFSQVTRIEKFMTVSGNPNLLSLNFSSLTYIGLDLNILNNEMLVDLGFPLLSYIGGNIDIEQNGLLINLLPNLTQFSGTSFISNTFSSEILCKSISPLLSTGIECHCNPGFEGDNCSSCSPAYYSIECLPCNCGSGNCSDGTLGNGSCTCSTNFAGTQCENCSSEYYSNLCLPCNCGNGKCIDGIKGNGSCICEYKDDVCVCEEDEDDRNNGKENSTGEDEYGYGDKGREHEQEDEDREKEQVHADNDVKKMCIINKVDQSINSSELTKLTSETVLNTDNIDDIIAVTDQQSDEMSNAANESLSKLFLILFVASIFLNF